MFLAKDFIETSEGLVFAVVESGVENDDVLCFLRYVRQAGQWNKLNTEQANRFLSLNFPDYLHFSVVKQVHCHAVQIDEVFIHHQPKKRLQQLLSERSENKVERDVVEVCSKLDVLGIDLKHVGITGSILIGAQNNTSDIDLVFYDHAVFHLARDGIRHLIHEGQLSDLSDTDWQESYQRRCCELSYEEYVWHEKRKFNKCLINSRKVDLGFVSPQLPANLNQTRYAKLHLETITVRIKDDTKGFEYPTLYTVYHPEIESIVCYTATYTGQAIVNEWVEVCGQLEEQLDNGNKRIIVGSSREAKGEYIKVVRHKKNSLIPEFFAVVFDMDGLVLDTESTYIEAWQKASRQMGIELSDQFCQSMSGMHFNQIKKALKNETDLLIDFTIFNELSTKYWWEQVKQTGIPVKKGFHQLIEVLKEKNIPFCLATNSRKDNALRCLELAGLSDVFKHIISADDVPAGKPSPDIFLKAANILGVPQHQCLVLEDSFIGVQGAVKAGMPTIFIPSSSIKEEQTKRLADLSLQNLHQLVEMLSKHDAAADPKSTR